MQRRRARRTPRDRAPAGTRASPHRPPLRDGRRGRRASRELPRDDGGCGARAVATPRSGPASERAGYAGALALLTAHPEITAIFAANDVMAIGALGAARELGLDVPRRLSIVGYDNTALAQTRLIDLTTVDDDSVGVGRESGRLLRARMAGEEPDGIRRTLEPALVVRGTTAPRA
ncbi:substrate-binding domain-containing protein [Microbacterium sp. B2969]|uniref:Substrate-binding domain-containing protein n=1 Tax=Microbacterium alkaliflavum TaxID=3248839 RepID=A0ABW7QCC8_9MICO